jgi:ATP-dependent protease ClpP protease subunit
LEEKQLEERLKGLQNNVENIAKVIAENTEKSVQEIRDAILERTILNPEEAKAWGLVHEIKSELFEAGSEVIQIQYQESRPNR